MFITNLITFLHTHESERNRNVDYPSLVMIEVKMIQEVSLQNFDRHFNNFSHFCSKMFLKLSFGRTLPFSYCVYVELFINNW